MTTQQIKAKELVDKFVNIQSLKDFGGMDMELAKQCAIICCDEKIETLLSNIGNQKHFWTEHERSLYDDLVMVKQEIEKL